tara:strand:- start:531 stop:947 length:417 start_codon:yes stop_codon:yes gene_type:complete
MKNLILVRGVSGSGKTTFANLIYGITNTAVMNVTALSADDYFTDEKGNYNFNASQLGFAHHSCQTKAKQAMENDVELILVHNTFTEEWEMEEYFNLADKYGYNVSSIVVENRHGSKSVHNVPESAITRQKDRFELKLT